MEISSMSIQHLTPAMFSLLSDGVLRAAPPELKNTGKADRRKSHEVSPFTYCAILRRGSVLNIARVGTGDIYDILFWNQTLLS